MLKVHFKFDLSLIADYGLSYTGRVRCTSSIFQTFFFFFLIMGPNQRYCQILPKFSCGSKLMGICLFNACPKLGMFQSVISYF